MTEEENLRDLGPRDWKMVGGELCLDFANTADWHASDTPQERLGGYEDLVSWGRHAGILSEGETRRLAHRASTHPKGAEKALRKAIALREAIYRIFRALAVHALPPAGDLDLLNEALAEALPNLKVARRGSDFVWEWAGVGDSLDGMLWPILRSAAEVLTSEKRTRLGQCADDRGCGWLFLDTSKNRSRRWCDMEDCGNRAKARRHYLRERGRSAVPAR
jgi:predicted RNA-binding Zn ribbon-like protein